MSHLKKSTFRNLQCLGILIRRCACDALEAHEKWILRGESYGSSQGLKGILSEVAGLHQLNGILYPDDFFEIRKTLLGVVPEQVTHVKRRYLQFNGKIFDGQAWLVENRAILSGIFNAEEVIIE